MATLTLRCDKALGYEVQLVSPQERRTNSNSSFAIRVKILKDGEVVHQWDSNHWGSFVFVDSVVVYLQTNSQFSPLCELTSFDLVDQKQLWSKDLKGFFKSTRQRNTIMVFKLELCIHRVTQASNYSKPKSSRWIS